MQRCTAGLFQIARYTPLRFLPRLFWLRKTSLLSEIPQWCSDTKVSKRRVFNSAIDIVQSVLKKEELKASKTPCPCKAVTLYRQPNGKEVHVYIHFKTANRSGRYLNANISHMWDLRVPAKTSNIFYMQDIKSYVRSAFGTTIIHFALQCTPLSYTVHTCDDVRTCTKPSAHIKHLFETRTQKLVRFKVCGTLSITQDECSPLWLDQNVHY